LTPGKEMIRDDAVVRPTSCTFGNEDLTLYITTASVGLSEAEIQNSFYSGDLFSLPSRLWLAPLTILEDERQFWVKFRSWFMNPKHPNKRGVISNQTSYCAFGGSCTPLIIATWKK